MVFTMKLLPMKEIMNVPITICCIPQVQYQQQQQQCRVAAMTKAEEQRKWVGRGNNGEVAVYG
jgi:hypothetical protein